MANFGLNSSMEDLLLVKFTLNIFPIHPFILQTSLSLLFLLPLPLAQIPSEPLRIELVSYGIPGNLANAF
jgi:hypothetical protein